MSKYLRIIDGTKSNAGGFEIKVGEGNISETWNPTIYDPAIMGSFNFSTEKKY